MMLPPPAAIIVGRTARLIKNAPVRLTDKTRNHSSVVISRIVPLRSSVAAALTRISIPPNLDAAATAAALVSASLLTSQRSGKLWTPHAVAVFCAAAPSISRQASLAPALANAIQRSLGQADPI